ncbi:MAG: substrate-binding domain-containing protein, partial [Halovenus sp.]
DGFDLTTRGSESPPRRVLAGKADVALGLGTTATKLDLGFVSLGDQQVRVLAASDRTSKPGVQQLEGLLPPADELVSDLDGFEI